MKRKITSLLLTVCLLVSIVMGFTVQATATSPVIWDGTVATGFDIGTGTETDPYMINTGAQLAYLDTAVNGGENFLGKYVKLGSDITLNTGSNADWETTAPANVWTPIGSGFEGVNGDETTPSTKTEFFAGDFDGNRHTISGMYVNSNDVTTVDTGYGLFCSVSPHANIHYFALVNSCVITNGFVAGAVTGYAYSANATEDGIVTFKNIYVDAIVKNTLLDSGDKGAGGILGQFATIGSALAVNVIDSCVVSGLVSMSYQSGGIVGNGNGKCITITDCLVTAEIYASYRYAAGIVGRDDQAGLTISNCLTTGKISGPEGDFIRVIANSNSSSKKPTVNNTYYTQDLTACRNCKESGNAMVAIDDCMGINAAKLPGTNWKARENDIVVPEKIQIMFAPVILSEKFADEYTITWKNYDGTALATEKYKSMQIPEYKGAVPTKPDDENYTYTFNLWDSEISAVDSDKTYTAEYYRTRKTSEVTNEQTTATTTNAITPDTTNATAPAVTTASGSV